jgi:hypothetical protein
MTPLRSRREPQQAEKTPQPCDSRRNVVSLRLENSERTKQMCTVSIKVNDALLNKALVNMDDDVDIAEWMQQQIEAILIRLAFASEKKVSEKPHFWDNYELSPEMLAILPQKRHNVYGDYKEEVTEILEEKYR